MSRVGKHPVKIPSGVECTFQSGVLRTKGKNGELSMAVSLDVILTIEDGAITVRPSTNSKQSRMMWGTVRRLVNSLVTGVHEGFKKDLEINGVGYRASIQGSKLVMQLGYSHDIEYPIPAGIKITCEKPTSISIFGADKQKVGQIASEIRSFRGPEPYKGKGIKYADEVILRKEGKKK